MDILTIDYNHETAGINFVKSLHETGFAIIKNHPIDYDLVKHVFSEWQAFFYTDKKFNYSYNKKKGDGYVGIDLSETAKGYSVPDLKEFYQLYFPWGRYPQELSNNTIEYFNKIYNLSNKLLYWIDCFSPNNIKNLFSEPVTKMVSFEQTMLRILHYPALSGNENKNAVRAAAHEDINLITLLPASTESGLQVKTKQDTWLDVGANKGEIIVNVGDMLQECSNYYYISTTHRVINPTVNNTARLSMPLFIHPRSDVYLSAKYSHAQMYLDERLAELGLLS